MTIFEKIANKEIPATFLFEDDEIIAFRDISPQAPVHVLITPKKCTPTINDVEPMQAELLGRMILVARKLFVLKMIKRYLLKFIALTAFCIAH